MTCTFIYIYPTVLLNLFFSSHRCSNFHFHNLHQNSWLAWPPFRIILNALLNYRPLVVLLLPVVSITFPQRIISLLWGRSDRFYTSFLEPSLTHIYFYYHNIVLKKAKACSTFVIHRYCCQVTCH